MRSKETETTSVPHRPQRPRRAEGLASGVAEWEKAGVGGAGTLRKNDQDLGVQ